MVFVYYALEISLFISSPKGFDYFLIDKILNVNIFKKYLNWWIFFCLRFEKNKKGNFLTHSLEKKTL